METSLQHVGVDPAPWRFIHASLKRRLGCELRIFKRERDVTTKLNIATDALLEWKLAGYSGHSLKAALLILPHPLFEIFFAPFLLCCFLWRGLKRGVCPDAPQSNLEVGNRENMQYVTVTMIVTIGIKFAKTTVWSVFTCVWTLPEAVLKLKPPSLTLS